MTELLDKNYNNELTAPANNIDAHTALGCVQNALFLDFPIYLYILE